MNKERRKSLLEVIDALHRAMDTLESIRDEEQDAYDNLPESLQGAERGEAMSEAVDTMDSATNDIDSVIETLDELL